MALVAGQKVHVSDMYRGTGRWLNNAGTAISATTDTPGTFPTTVIAAPTFIAVSGTNNSIFTAQIDGIYTIDTSVRCSGGGNLQCSIYLGSGAFSITAVRRQGVGPITASCATTIFLAANTSFRVNWWFPTGANLDTGFGEATGLAVTYHGPATP